MQVTLTQIPTREILHFLGWHGTPVEPGLKETIKRFQEKALRKIEPRVVVREFELSPDGTLAHTRFLPLGKDVPCHAVRLSVGCFAGGNAGRGERTHAPSGTVTKRGGCIDSRCGAQRGG
ncbi:MAG: hypothetical protein ACLR4A_03825 [Christensenellales bacterium]